MFDGYRPSARQRLPRRMFYRRKIRRSRARLSMWSGSGPGRAWPESSGAIRGVHSRHDLLQSLPSRTPDLSLRGSVRERLRPIPLSEKTIRVLLPFPAGGSTDPIARLIAEKLTNDWAQPVIVDNRPGGNTIIGTEALAKAPADGHTLLYTASTHVINALLVANLPYDSFKDFQPVATIVRSEFVLVVHPSVPASNLQEFIALAKSKPGAINYATSGNGNPNHLAGEYFAMLAGVRLTNIPYRVAVRRSPICSADRCRPCSPCRPPSRVISKAANCGRLVTRAASPCRD